MWAFVIVIGALLVAAVARPNIPQAQKFDGELEFPTVDEGRPIPVVFGTVNLKAPNVVWWGDWEQRAIKVDGERIGYYQWAGVHMVFCHGPVDALLGIYGDKDKKIWTGTISSNQRIYVEKENLYGERKKGEGGVKGNISIEFGAPTQGKNAYLQQQQGLCSAHRGMFALVLEKVKLGNTKSPKPWWVQVRRVLKSGRDGGTQWYSEKAAIGSYDMNPAHIVRECLLDKDWGAGENINNIAPGNLEAMADLFHAEGLGLSMVWDTKGDVYEFIESVLQQCNAVLYQDPSDGLLYLKAIRGDYNVEDLPVISRTYGSIKRVRKLSRPAPAEQVNTLTAKYNERGRDEQATMTLQDQAAVELYGQVADEIKYSGLRDPDTVAKALARDLAVASRSLRTCSVVCNRDAASLKLGSPFILDDFMVGLNNVVMRVTEIDYGAGDSGDIAITCVEDAFSAPEPFRYVPPTTWVPPSSEPLEVATGKLVALPRALVRQALGDSWASVTPSSQLYYGMLAQIPADGMADFDAILDANNDGVYEIEAGSGGFCATILTDGDLDYDTTEIPVAQFTLASRIEVGEYLLVNDEWMKVTAVGAASVTVVRAIFDTVPKAHASGSVGFVVNPLEDDFPILAAPQAVSGAAVKVKPLVIASGGQLTDATPFTGPTPSARQAAPLPPGYVTVNGNLFPDAYTFHSGAVTLAWKRRANDNTTAETIGWFGNGDYASSATHTVEVWNGDKTVQGTTLTGSTSATYSNAQEVTDFGALQESLTFVVYATENSLNSSKFEVVSYRNPAELNPPTYMEFDGSTIYVDVTE